MKKTKTEKNGIQVEIIELDETELYVTPYKAAANAELYLWQKERNVGVNL